MKSSLSPAAGVQDMLEDSDVATRLPAQDLKRARGAWFKDSEGNLLGLGQPVR